jgi:hypothetical protein
MQPVFGKVKLISAYQKTAVNTAFGYFCQKNNISPILIQADLGIVYSSADCFGDIKI